MNTSFQPPSASISLLWNLDFPQWELYLSTWSRINRISKTPIMTRDIHIQTGEQKIYFHYCSLTHLLWLQSVVGALNLTQCYTRLLRNIDCRATYTSSSFIIDNFVQGELSIFECKAQCGVFIPSLCGWLRCFSGHSAAEAQGVSIGCD